MPTRARIGISAHQGEFRSCFRWFVMVLLAIALAGCDHDEDSDVTSGGGNPGVGSDGGAPSAQFAGTYSGTIKTVIVGDEIDDESYTEAVTVLIRTDGTAQITIDGETVQGTVNGNRFGFSIRRDVNRGLLDCEGDAVITGTVEGSSLTGTVNGSGECELLFGQTGFTMTGSMTASRI